MKRLLLAIILVSAVFFVSNCGKKSEILGSFKESSKFTLNSPLRFANIKEFNGDFIAIDWAKPELFIFNNAGEVISSFNKVGKGPGELGQFGVDLIGTVGNTIYLSDRFANKIMIYSYDASKKSIAFSDEFPINDGRVNAAAIGDDGLLYCNVDAKDFQYFVFDAKGTLVKKLVPKKPAAADAPIADSILYGMRYEIKHKNGIYSAGYMDYKLNFYVNGKDGELTAAFQGLPKYVFNKENFKVDTTNNSFSLSGSPGITGIFLLNDSLIFMVLADNNDENVFIQSYNAKGEYEGKYLLDGVGEKTNFYIVGCNGKDTLYYMVAPEDNDKTVRTTSEIVVAKLQSTTKP